MNKTKENFFSSDCKEEFQKNLAKYETDRKNAINDRQQQALRTAKQVAQLLINDYHATSVILFGSLAYGNFGERSDIDLYVIGFQGNYWEAISRAQEISGDIEISIMCEEDAYEEFRREANEKGIRLC